MYLLENPVLQRELVVNLRRPRAFMLLFVYQFLLASVVFFAWPREQRLDLSESPASARKLADLFFLGQYVLASLMAPSFAGGAITGEKERKTYEMLLASPLRPGAIVLGKLVASLAHLVVLVISSLPIIMLCLPLGGVHPTEVAAAYVGLASSVLLFGMIGIACSSYFQRTVAALVVSYLCILPIALAAVVAWNVFAGEQRLWLTVTVAPTVAIVGVLLLYYNASGRLLYPRDVGSEGKEVVDIEQEAKEAIGMVIQPDQFPDKLFAPAKRTSLLEDGANAIYDKEIRSEIFSQGTLMLRIVIQVSMLLAFPIMAYCLFMNPKYAPYYIGYVLLFNILISPVVLAGSITNERERQTLDLLLTTVITPWTILWGKLVAGLRISTVLTLFLFWPVLLATLLEWAFWPNLLQMGTYLLITLLACLTTGMIALSCSVACRRTTTSLMMTYMVILTLFLVPLATGYFAREFFPTDTMTPYVLAAGVTSPFWAAFEVPLLLEAGDFDAREIYQRWWNVAYYGGAALLLNGVLFGSMIVLFNRRWRAS